MAEWIDDERQEYKLDAEGDDDGFGPGVGDVVEMECLFDGKVYESHKDTVETENHHRANGNPYDDAWSKIIGAAPKADDGEDGNGIHDEV